MNNKNVKKQQKRTQSLKKPRKLVQSGNKRSIDDGFLSQSTESPPQTPSFEVNSKTQSFEVAAKKSTSNTQEIQNESTKEKKTSGVPVPEDDVMAQLEDVLAKTLKKDKGKKRGLPEKSDIVQETIQFEEDKPEEKEETKIDQEVEEVVKPQETRTVQQDAIPVSVDKKEPTFTFLPNGVRAKKYTERQERLLKDAVAAFVYMINRKSLVRQRWRKWKTTKGGEKDSLFDEDYEPEWMRNDTQNYAIGRRIYDKNEIENENNVREKLTHSNQAAAAARKIDLKNAAEVFGLWDNVYGKDAIKALEHAQKWDPSRLGNKDKKVVQKKPLAVSIDPALPSEENSDDGDQNQISYVDLTNEELDAYLSETNFNSVAIRNWHKAFYTECPNGQLTKEHMQKMFLNLFPMGDCMPFCNAIFRIFSNRQSADFLEFKEFLKAVNVTTIKSEEERLKWAFRLYDADNSGSLNFEEMSAVIRMLEDFEGSKQKDGEAEDQIVNQLFQSLDSDGNGQVSMEEFVEGYMKLKARMEAMKSNNTVVLSMTISDKKSRDRDNLHKQIRNKEKASKQNDQT